MAESFKLTLVTGVFDLLHQEHINFLKKAKKISQFLTVGIESDHRVKAIKGPSRPMNNQHQRLEKLRQLGFIDSVFILPEKFETDAEHLALLSSIKPNILAVSAHTPHLDKKRQLMKIIGGEVRVVYEQNPQVSTTQLLAKK